MYNGKQSKMADSFWEDVEKRLNNVSEPQVTASQSLHITRALNKLINNFGKNEKI